MWQATGESPDQIEWGLTFIKEKCIFYLLKLTFIGLVLWQQGIGPTEDKVEVLTQAREPKNASEVKSFLGLVNFNTRFIPELRRLTKVEEPVCFLSRAAARPS